MAIHAEDPLHPEELSRRISEIDLTNLRRRADTGTGNPPRYSQAEIIKMRSATEKNEEHVAVANLAEGLKTPPNIPDPPPPTPDDYSDDTPGGHDSPLDDNDSHGVQSSGADTKTVNQPRYSREELLKLRLASEKTSTDDRSASPVGREFSDDGGDSQALQAPLEAGKKKKKKSKSKSKKGRGASTGFEEFYADPPITPDEYDEESDLYAPSQPFHARMEACIQRYRKKRNLDEHRALILTRYFQLGGVESSTTKPFTGGLDEETLEKATAAEIAAIQATDHIRAGAKNGKYYNPSEPEKWVVDFEGVVKGFLSWTVPRRWPLHNEKEVKQICMVIKNFLNYVLHHGVCPEYTTDILEARMVCDAAEKELWSMKQAQYLLPGAFNMAASTLYGGHYQGLQFSPEWAVDDLTSGEFLTIQSTLGDHEAERIFKTAIAYAGSEDLFLEAMKADVAIINTETKYFEVVTIERASIQAIDEYSKIQNMKGEQGAIKPLGVVYVKDWEGPGLDIEDMTDDEDESPPVERVIKMIEKPVIETFWIEDGILQHFFVGMRLELVVHELNIGIKFFDRVLGVYSSFHTVLPNEKVLELWKEPVPNTRAPPTEDNPYAEEDAMAFEEDRELEAFDKDFGEKKKIDTRMTEEKPKNV